MDAFKQLAAAGVDTVRLRAWVGPTTAPVYCNTPGVLLLAQRAKAAGDWQGVAGMCLRV